MGERGRTPGISVLERAGGAARSYGTYRSFSHFPRTQTSHHA